MDIIENKGEIAIYQAKGGKLTLDVKLEKDTVWLTQKQIAQLFGTKTQAITKHIGNILATGELRQEPTCSKMEQVQHEGGRNVKRVIDIYNLDMVISIGYRVNSTRATDFRIWATGVLRDHITKGFTLYERRIKDLEDKSLNYGDNFLLMTRNINKILINMTHRDYVHALEGENENRNEEFAKLHESVSKLEKVVLGGKLSKK